MNSVWCKKCQSDVENVHYGSCPDHPTRIALLNRKPVSQDDAAAVGVATGSGPQNWIGPKVNGKADWFSAESELKFSEDQLKKVFEYFLHNVLDLTGVEVVRLKNSLKGTTIVFKKLPVEVPKEVVHNEVVE